MFRRQWMVQSAVTVGFSQKVSDTFVPDSTCYYPGELYFPASKQKKTRNRLFVVLFLQEVYHANFGYYGSIDITDLIIQEVIQNN